MRLTRWAAIALIPPALMGCGALNGVFSTERVLTSPAGAWTVSVRALGQGDHSGVTDPAWRIARSAQEYAALAGPMHPNGSAPPVDFAREMVLAVFLGQRPTGGFAVAVDAYQEEREALRARVVEKRPAPDAMVMQVVTTPYALVAVPRSDKPVQLEGLSR